MKHSESVTTQQALLIWEVGKQNALKTKYRDTEYHHRDEDDLDKKISQFYFQSQVKLKALKSSSLTGSC